MDVKEAVAVAKSYVSDVYIDEDIVNLGLEEIEFDGRADVWCVTLGFSRPWQGKTTLANVLVSSSGRVPRSGYERSYKVLRIHEDGRVESIKDRFGADDRD